MPKLATTVEKKASKQPSTSRPSSQKKTERNLSYPDIKIKLCRKASNTEMTDDTAKKLLDWHQPTENEKFGKEYMFKDRYGVETRCGNVGMQRAFRKGQAEYIMYEILNRNWKLNGESMIVGKTGLTIDCQHRLIGLVWAVQEWEKDQANDGKRFPKWGNEKPYIDCVVVLGVDEDAHTVNTINTGKSRSLDDALFASGVFNWLDPNKSADRRTLKSLTKICDYAVRMLWNRTGAMADAFSPKRTHAESLDFIERHPKLLECVRHICEEDGGKKELIKRHLSPGYASALLYLMASCESDRGEYIADAPPNERALVWTKWDDACDFWVKLAGQDKTFNPVRQAIADLINAGKGGNRCVEERMAVLIKAWDCLQCGEAITAKALELETELDGNGIPRLTETVTLNGIDCELD